MKKAIKILTLLLALALVISAFAVMVLATDDCVVDEVNVAPLASVSGDKGPGTTAGSVATEQSLFWKYANDGDRLTVSPANKNAADNYGLWLNFENPYKFTKIVLQTYGVGRAEEDYTISEWISGKTSEYDIQVTLYDGDGEVIVTKTVKAGGKDDFVIELDEDIARASRIYVFFVHSNAAQQQAIWEVYAYTTEDHDWQYVEETIPSSCTEDGKKVVECADCGEVAEVVSYAKGHKSYCTTTCINDDCEETVEIEHVKKAGSSNCANPECGALGVFPDCSHKADPRNPCSGVCVKCGEPESVPVRHTADKTNPCNNNCSVCGAIDVIPDAYDLGALTTKTSVALEYTYVSHVANPTDPCDTTCYSCGRIEAVKAAHVPDPVNPCTVSECAKCGRDGVFAHYSRNYNANDPSQYLIYEPHVRPDTVYGATTSTGAYSCRLYCLNCKAGGNSTYYLPYAHEFDNCADARCNVCNDSVAIKERQHSFTEESPYRCVDCGWYDNATYTLCLDGHIYSNRCDQKCNDCGAQGKKSYLNGSNLVPEYWHVYDNACDTTCNDCGEERTTEHTFPTAECGELCTVCGESRVTTVPHTYSDVLDANDQPIANSSACDTICDACNETRAVPHDFPEKCTPNCLICTLANPTIEHTYTDDCDSDCNVDGCDGTRVAPHNFAYVCDAKCRDCDSVNPDAVAHIYCADCDADCDRDCGFVRTGVAHVYDNAHDATCNNSGCNFIRNAQNDSAFVPACVYDNACDTTCNACSATREVGAHVYDDATDTTCNECGDVRVVTNNGGSSDSSSGDNGSGDSGEKDGLGGGAIAGIVAGSAVLLGGGGFATYWFVFRKKRM